MFTGLERPSAWALIAVAALVLFGYKKMPEMARSVGRSLRVFKTEMKGMADDDSSRESTSKSPEDSLGTDSPSFEEPAAPESPVVPAATPTVQNGVKSATVPVAQSDPQAPPNV
jgi:sec-independent protein translocase protein TatA